MNVIFASLLRKTIDMSNTKHHNLLNKISELTPQDILDIHPERFKNKECKLIKKNTNLLDKMHKKMYIKEEVSDG